MRGWLNVPITLCKITKKSKLEASEVWNRPVFLWLKFTFERHISFRGMAPVDRHIKDIDIESTGSTRTGE